MNKKEAKFLDNKLLELVENNIISVEQYNKAKNYFYNNIKPKSIVTIFSAIGIFLIALSIITLFAFNWSHILKEVKIAISFVPILITSIMLYFYMKKENKSLQIYTSIFAPISILATNSLISQVFHIQLEIYELIFISLLMYLPISFILRNYISIITYSFGTIFYAFSIIGSPFSENIGLLNVFILSMPLVIYNVLNYIKDKNSGKNIIMWCTNIIILSLFLFYKEIFSPDSFLIYIYTLYLITLTLFKDIDTLNKLLSLLFTAFLLISCTNSIMVSYASFINLGLDTLFIAIIALIFVYLSKVFKNPKEYFIFAFILLLQFSHLDKFILFILINIIALSLGLYKIIIGNKSNSFKLIKQGIFIILLLIIFRFVNSDMSFKAKSIMFLITGIGFIIGANIMKKRIGGNEIEKFDSK